MDPKTAVKQMGKLMSDLRAFSPEAKKDAVSRLVTQHGAEQAAALLQALMLHADEEIQEAGGEGLAHLGRLDLLLEASTHPNAQARFAAANGFALLSDPVAIEGLTRLAEDPDTKVAYRAILDLGRHGSQTFDRILQIGADSESSRIRGAAQIVFTRVPAETAPFLLGVLNRADDAQCEMALYALSFMAFYELNLDAASPLLRFLERASTPTQKRLAIEALRTTQDRRVVPPLLQLAGDAEPGVLKAIAETLGAIGDPEALPLLTQLTQSQKSPVRKAAIESIGRLRQAAALPHLEQAMDDPSVGIRKAAAYSLGHLPEDTGVEALCVALNDADVRVRKEAAFALSLRGRPESLAALQARMQPGIESDPDTRHSIRQAIHAIERSGAGTPSLLPAYTGRLVPESPELSRVGLSRTRVPCTCCGGVCHEVASVPGEQIGHAGKHFRLIRCVDCYFYGPHYVYWQNGQPVRAVFADGDAQELLEGECDETSASILWEPGPPPGEDARSGFQTVAGPRPNWLQSDEWPACPECRGQMEFIFQLASSTLDTLQYDTDVNNGFSLVLEHYATFYYFICEGCQVSATISQCT